MAEKKLKILQVIYCLRRGGAERLAIDIARQLSTRPDVEVLLVSFAPAPDDEFPLDDIDYQYCPAGVSLSLLRPNRYSLDNYIKLINDFTPDIIHSHLFATEIITRSYLSDNCRYFTHCHDNMVQLRKASLATFTQKKLLTNYYERSRLLKQYKSCNNQFIAISKNTFNYFRDNLPASFEDNIHLFPNAIDFEKFNSVNHIRDTSSIRMVNTGSFFPNKNQAFLIEVMNNLKKKNVPASLTFLGAGSELQNVKDRAKEYGLEEQITFVGSVDNVEQYLKEPNLYVHAAHSEAFGLVLVEALAGGLPVVTLDGKGNRDLIKEGGNGFMLAEQNVELFAQKVIEVMSSEKNYIRMSRFAVEFARQFDIKNYVDRLLELYRA